MHTVAIVMATFNGERFLTRQLTSLLAQTTTDWHLWIRDDGSTDGTVAIIDDFARRDRRISRVRDDLGNIGPVRGFARLLQQLPADISYAMFCDQDDEWLPDKITVSVRHMRELEHCHPGVPVLVHTDLIVIDEQGDVTNSSFWAYSGIDPFMNSLSRLFFQNTVTGCTALLNRPLLDRTRESLDGAEMHDWWVALVARGFGIIEPLRHATVRYRQHSANVLGARRRTALPWSFVGRLLVAPHAAWRRRRQDLIAKPLAQALAFCTYFGDSLPEAERSLVRQLVSFEKMSWHRRRSFLVRERCLRQRAIHNLSLLLLA